MSSNFTKTRSGLTVGSLSSDPVDGVNGDIYYNTVLNKFRKYQNGSWEDMDTAVSVNSGFQEYTHKARFEVRAASTANITISTQAENGDSFGGVTLVTGDLILLKNQTTTFENGVYEVQASGTPVRHTSYDDATELTNAHIHVSSGTNANTVWFQNNTLTTLTDAQSWASSPAAFTFVVPSGVDSISLMGNGGGGGGGGGGGANAANNNSANGGSGGLGSALQELLHLSVIPGSSLTINLGVGGVRGGGGSPGPTAGSAGGNGTNTTVSGFTTNVTQIVFPGARGGPGGLAGVATTPTPTNTSYTTVIRDGNPVWLGGAGGQTNAGTSATGASAPTQVSIRGASITGAVGGVGGTQLGGGFGGGGGGGGASSNFGAGGAGGRGANNGASNNVIGFSPSATNYGAGGGGGGGGSEAGNVSGKAGGWGADGYLRITW